MVSIQLIDDDIMLLDMMGFMLERAGFAPLLAGTGEEGLQQALTKRPSLVVADVRLPGMDGYEVCRRLRSAGFDAPVVLTSGGDDDAAERARQAGAQLFLAKPFGARELLSRVMELLPLPGSLLRHGALTLDLDRHTAWHAGKPVSLTPEEFRELSTLLQQPGIMALSAEDLLEAVRGASAQSVPTATAPLLRLSQQLGMGAGASPTVTQPSATSYAFHHSDR